MTEKELIQAINGQSDLAVDTKLTVPQLKAILTGLEAETVIAEMAARIEELEAGPKAVELPVVTHSKKKYKFDVPTFHFKGKVYSAKEAAADKKLFTDLIKVGVLVAVTEN